MLISAIGWCVSAGVMQKLKCFCFCLSVPPRYHDSLHFDIFVHIFKLWILSIEPEVHAAGRCKHLRAYSAPALVVNATAAAL